MNDIVQMSKGGTKFYPQTHVQAVLGLNSVGTNLYTDTRDFDNPSAWNSWWNWQKTGEKFNGLTVMETDGNWEGLRQPIQVKKGETYTYSVYARYKSGTGKSSVLTGTNNATALLNQKVFDSSLTDTWQRISTTFIVFADGTIDPSLCRTTNNTNTLLIAGPKLEKGPTATDYSLNPLDVATDGSVQTAIANALGKVATINVISQADYDKLADKSGVYFIEG